MPRTEKKREEPYHVFSLLSLQERRDLPQVGTQLPAAVRRKTAALTCLSGAEEDLLAQVVSRS